jgi:predicted O-methyltransferase YrrM
MTAIPAEIVLPPLDDEATDLDSLKFLAALMRFEKPKVIVEAGTYRGHGALFMAMGLRSVGTDGHIWTADPIDQGVAAYISRNGLDGTITYRNQPFDEMLPDVPTPIDFAFIDASDRRPGGDLLMRLHHLNLVMPKMRRGGLVVVHDTGAKLGDWHGLETILQMGGVNLRGPRGLTLIQVKL